MTSPEQAPRPRGRSRQDGGTGEAAKGAGRGRLGLFLAGGLALLVLLGAMIWLETRPGAGAAGGNLAASGATSGAAAIGGPFELIDQDGRPVDQRLLEGRWSAVFFGYTYCPDTCPATLQTLAAAADRMGPKAKDFQVVLITVDPQRDTPAKLKAYLSSQAFPKRALGLTGTPEQIAAVERAYKVYAAKSGSGDDYLMDHTAAVYLMNPQGRFVRPLSDRAKPEQMAAEIAGAMGLRRREPQRRNGRQGFAT